MRLILSLSLALAAINVLAADVDVYRATAPDGTVIYSDRPTGPNAVPVALSVMSPVTPPPAPTVAAARQDTSDAADGDGENPAEALRLERERVEQRTRNCGIARERAESYTGARRLYRELANGAREYLTDAEIDEARARAAADVEFWCS